MEHEDYAGHHLLMLCALRERVALAPITWRATALMTLCCSHGEVVHIPSKITAPCARLRFVAVFRADRVPPDYRKRLMK